ncbi:MAG: hypothetical protein ACOX6Q_02790 [Candidatus Dojkabacteria bacterium]|jgi:hypothetical protein
MMVIIEKLNSLFVGKAYAGLSDTLNRNVGALGEGFGDEKDFVGKIIDVAVPLGVGCAVILLAYGGYMLIASKGNPDKLQEAQGIITNAIIGLLVVLLSVSILLIISSSLDLGIYE